MSTWLDRLLAWLFDLAFPPDNDEMVYCPECGGSGIGKNWVPCPYCNAIGYVSKYKSKRY